MELLNFSIYDPNVYLPRVAGGAALAAPPQAEWPLLGRSGEEQWRWY